MKTYEQIMKRIVEKEKSLDVFREHIRNSKELDYNQEDLEGELDNIKADLRILRWVLN